MAVLFTIGNLTVDDIVLHDGRVWIGQAGGDALYSALGARLWCGDVGVIARVGNDLPAEFRAALERLGIELVLVPTDSPNIRNWALYEADGSRQFVRHAGSGGHDELAVRAAELPPAACHAAAYHLAAMPATRQLELARALRSPATLITLDPHADYLVGYEAAIEQILGLVDVFMPSREEARRLVGHDDPALAARTCAAAGPPVVVVKLGADGALVYEAGSGRLTHIPCCPVGAVDTTGAGDAFCGGFLARYLASRDAVDAACYGTVSASFVVERIGALADTTFSRADARSRLRALRAAVARDGSPLPTPEPGSLASDPGAQTAPA